MVESTPYLCCLLDPFSAVPRLADQGMRNLVKHDLAELATEPSVNPNDSAFKVANPPESAICLVRSIHRIPQVLERDAPVVQTVLVQQRAFDPAGARIHFLCGTCFLTFGGILRTHGNGAIGINGLRPMGSDGPFGLAPNLVPNMEFKFFS
jgi:hypothetical protein